MGNVRTLLDTAVTQASKPYGLAVGKAGCNVPIGGFGNFVGNFMSNGTDTSGCYRLFIPLSDGKAGCILPVFNNHPNPTSIPGDVAAPNAITVACAVELSDGTVMPFTFNGGNHTVTIPAGGGVLATPDNPLAFGAQITDATFGNGVMIRTYVTVPLAGRTESVTTTSGSPTVSDTGIAANDQGRLITGTGIPASAYVGTVTPGVSFLLSSRPDSQVNANATASGTVTATIKSIWPLNYGVPTFNNNAYRSAGTNPADLTLEGSTGGAAAAFSANAQCYGPCTVLGPIPSGRKPIALSMSDSIFAGTTDQIIGPVGRAAALLGIPHVKMSQSSETAGAMSTPLGRRYRAVLIPGTTHAIVEYGTNDGVTSAGSVTSIQASLTALGTYLASLGIKPWLCTVPPKGLSSTDGYATTANQTPFNVPANLATLNSWIRGLPSPYVGYIDLHDLVASGRDTGLWAQAPVARHLTDLTTTIGTNVVTSASANFTGADQGFGLFVTGALNTTITSITNPTTVVVAANASATVTGAVGGVGSFYATADGTHPSTAFMQGAIVNAVRAIMAGWSL